MQFLPAERSRRIAAALWTLIFLFLIYAAMSACSGVDPASYPYNSYLLQARAWLRGEIALEKNYEYLELAVYEGKYYVSFPPVPAIPMAVFSLIWGEDVPGGLIQKIYVAIACLVALSEIRRSKGLSVPAGIVWALFICIGSAMLPVSLVGGVWYEAQILCFLFSICAIVAMRRGRPTVSCICYALGVGCRPFSVVLGPALLAMYIQRERYLQKRLPRRHGPRRAMLRLAPGVNAGLCIAAGYAAYNYARFGNIFEFGHNYLPEFVQAEHGQLSLRYIADNWRTLLFGSPFTLEGGRLSIYPFGFSMFLSCPILICNLVWLIQDIRNRRIMPAKLTLLAMGTVNVFLLLMHRTLGALQFGARYALELVPLCFAWYLLSPERKKTAKWEAALMLFGLVFNFTGGCLVHI